MKFPTIIKKYRITDYSQLSDDDLVKQIIYFKQKLESETESKLTHDSMRKMFSLFLNLHNLSQEIFKRAPGLKDKIDFDGDLEEIFKVNSITKNQN